MSAAPLAAVRLAEPMTPERASDCRPRLRRHALVCCAATPASAPFRDYRARPRRLLPAMPLCFPRLCRARPAHRECRQHCRRASPMPLEARRRSAAPLSPVRAASSILALITRSMSRSRLAAVRVSGASVIASVMIDDVRLRRPWPTEVLHLPLSRIDLPARCH